MAGVAEENGVIVIDEFPDLFASVVDELKARTICPEAVIVSSLIACDYNAEAALKIILAEGYEYVFNLPEELVQEIFYRSAVKFVARGKTLNKRWNELIHSPQFVEGYIRNESESILTWSSARVPHVEGQFTLYNQRTKVTSRFDAPFLSAYFEAYPESEGYFHENTHILGPCNGYVCLILEEQVSLCNPGIELFRNLPACPLVLSRKHYVKNLLGQAFGVASEDYKVLLLWEVYDRVEGTSQQVSFIYNISTNVWSQLNSIAQILPYLDHPTPVVTVNEFFHWVARWASFSKEKSILCFDINREIFSELAFPAWLMFEQSVTPFLAANNGLLSFVVLRAEFIEVWVMKSYGCGDSWMKLYIAGPYPSIVPLMIWNGGSWLLAKDEMTNKLKSCSLEKKRIKKFPLISLKGDVRAVAYLSHRNLVSRIEM